MHKDYAICLILLNLKFFVCTDSSTLSTIMSLFIFPFFSMFFLANRILMNANISRWNLFQLLKLIASNMSKHLICHTTLWNLFKFLLYATCFPIIPVIQIVYFCIIFETNTSRNVRAGSRKNLLFFCFHYYVVGSWGYLHVIKFIVSILLDFSCQVKNSCKLGFWNTFRSIHSYPYYKLF